MKKMLLSRKLKFVYKFTFLLFTFYFLLFTNITDNNVFGQTFTNSTPQNLTNNNATTITSCPSPTATGVNSVYFDVSGIGTLTNDGTKELKEIRITLNGGNRAVNNTNMRCYLKAPNSSSCILLYDGSGSNTSTTNTVTSNYVFKNGSDNCLDVGNIYPKNYTFQDINSAPSAFAPDNGVELRNAFNGINANGQWTLIFCSKSYTSKNRHDFVSASLVFGSNSFGYEDNTSESGLCAGAIPAVQWYGDPSCYNNKAGKTSADQGADNNVYPGNNPGGNCDWNNANNYTTYIKFTPTKTPVTLTVQGNGDTFKRLQTIVLKPNNTSINPCTSGSPVSWSVVSCPRDNIYTINIGTHLSQTHTFPVTIGDDYYLVVDGSGVDANTNYTLTGDIGVQSGLPISLLTFDATPNSQGVALNWSTASERNNDYFTISRSSDMENWEAIGTVRGNGNSNYQLDYEFIDIAPIDGVSYYQLKQTDYNGENESFDPVSVYVNAQNLNNSMVVYPNPTDAGFDIKVNAQRANLVQISIHNTTGKAVILQNTQLEKGMNVVSMKNERLDQGVYLVQIQFEDGSTCMTKLVVE